MIIDGSINKLERPLKLELTYKLLLALRDQVTKLAIVHRDLKPENILVQITPKIVVNIIDYGLAKEKGVKDQSLAGTVSYMPPEAFRSKKQNTPCDVFSMAKVITLLWVNDFSLYDVQDLKQGYRYGFNSARWVRNYRKKNQDSECNILKLLEKMLCPHPNNRITIDKAIALFENAYPQYKQSPLSTENSRKEEKFSEDLVKNTNFHKLQRSHAKSVKKLSQVN